MLSRVKTVKMRLIAGVGYTLPMQVQSINKGFKPDKIDVEDGFNITKAIDTTLRGRYIEPYVEGVKYGKQG